MQRPEHYLKSGRPSPANSTDEEFAQGEQTAGKVPAPGIAEQDTEIVKTHYSPRGVFFVYFQGEASIEVDKHFNQTFSGLCYLPSDAAEKRVDGSRLQGTFLIEYFYDTYIFNFISVLAFRGASCIKTSFSSSDEGRSKFIRKFALYIVYLSILQRKLEK